MAQRNRRRQRRRGGVGAKLALLGGTLFVVLVFGVFAIASWVLNVAADAPSLAACKQVDRTGNSVIYAGDGSKLGLIESDEARDPVSIERIPKQLQLATVAIEDQRFYEHGGIDPEGIARAALKNLEAGKTVEGGSTITQQLVRHLCLHNPKRDLERKIIEAKLAIEYAEQHSRVEILDQYLNTATYGTVEGATTVGVGAAAQIYFSKPVWKLSLEQSALLAGLPQAPSEYNPILHPHEALQRRNSVLAKMGHLGYLSPARARQAEESGLGLNVSGSYFAHREPFFFDYVEHELIERYGAQTVRNGGIKAYTTIQPRLQEVGLEAMRSALPYSTDPSSAMVSINPSNGEIESMVSSSSYDSSQFNLAAQGHRQPGSTFKAFVLTTAIKQGIDPYTTYYVSKPLDLNLPKWGHWEVHTADEGYLGKAGDRRFRQHGLRSARPRRRSRTGRGNGEVDGNHQPARRHPGRGYRRPAGRRLAAGTGRCLRDPRRRRHPPRPDRDQAGRLRRRQDRAPRPQPAAARHLRSGRLRGDPPAARQHHRRHRHRRLHRLPRPSRQDRYHRS
jgi:penicillin-binding protein 1A